MAKTNAEVIANSLKNFAKEERVVQEILAEYVACPNAKNCSYEGDADYQVCLDCKINWLLSPWEE